MGYRSNLGCLWILLFVLLIGGTPLLVGVLRLLVAFIAIVVVGGALLSWWVRRQAVLRYTGGQSERHNRFVELLVKLLVRLAEIDGTLDRSEVTAIRLFFQRDLGYTDERLLWVRDLIKAARESGDRVEDVCAELREGFLMQERFIALQALARVAEADGHVTPAEMAFIEAVSGHLGLDPFVRGFASMGGRAGAGPGTAPSQRDVVGDALGVLGLERGASADEVKRAWRELSMENHPDRVTHLGEEFRKLAEERMREINRAYETLKEAGVA